MPEGIGYPAQGGFDPAALRSQLSQQRQSLPGQAQQAQSGRQGFLESLRGLSPPSVNLPSPRIAAQGGAAPNQGQGLDIRALLEQMRARMGQQGIGGSIGQGGLPGQLPQPIQQFAAPQSAPPLRQAPSAPTGVEQFTGAPLDQGPGLGQNLPGSSVVQGGPAQTQPTTFGQNLVPRPPAPNVVSSPTSQVPTSFGSGLRQPQQTQSRYGSLAGRQSSPQPLAR